MNLPAYFFQKKHLIFDVETFGLSGSVFAFGAVLGEFRPREGHARAAWQTLAALALTHEPAGFPWRYEPNPIKTLSGTRLAREGGRLVTAGGVGADVTLADYEWLVRNIPTDIFVSNRRVSNSATMYEAFATFVQPHLGNVELWAECPVPCEATFLREVARISGPPWGTVKIPPLCDIASLADALRIDDERADRDKPAHDPLNDAQHSASRLTLAVNKLLRLTEP